MTNKQYADKNHSHEPNTALWIMICVVICMFHVCDDKIHAQPVPQDTLITFTDGADLQRQVREIGAVCDSVEIGTWPTYYLDLEADSSWTVMRPVYEARCRTNVQVQWFINPSLKAEAGLHVVNIANPIPYVEVPGEALITWEWE